MKKRSFILAIDQGTTSSRAVIFDKNAKVLGMAQHEFTQILPRPGYVEHDPDEIIASQFKAIKDAFKDSSVGMDEIAAIAVTNQRETTIVWDKNTGKPIHNAIVWQCRRTAPQCELLTPYKDYIRDKTGLVLDAYFSGTKISWILDRCEGARERANAGELAFGTVDSWLIYKLTGVHATDYSNASRTMLFDIKTLRYDTKLLDLVGVPESMLPVCLPSSALFGKVKSDIPGLEALAGVPICGVAGDQQAALFGQCCFDAGDMKTTFGTGCFLMMNTGEKPVDSKNGLITTIAWGLNGRVTYALEGSVFNAGSAIKWLRDELCIISTPQECDRLAETVPDAAGAYFVPAFTGLGAPYWDMYARGALVELTRGFSRAHLCRAVLEGIAYQACDITFAMSMDSGFFPRHMRVDGGASNSDCMMQFEADMLDCDIVRPKNVEATALGASFLAGLYAGIYTSLDDICALPVETTVFSPVMPRSECNARYAGWKKAVDRVREK